MEETGLTLLSTACLALSVCGGMLTLRPDVTTRTPLRALFAVVAGLAGFPVTVSALPGLAQIHLAMLLPLLLALSPLFFFYVRARSQGDVPARPWRHLALPGFGMALAVILIAQPEATRNLIFNQGLLPEGAVVRALLIAVFLLVLSAPIVSLGYLWASVRELRRYRAQLRDVVSNTDGHEIRWVDSLVAALVALWMVMGIALVSDNLFGGLWVSGELVMAVLGAFLLILVVFGLAPTPAADPSLTVEEAPTVAKYERSALSAERSAELAAQIERAMADQALYLDPNLSLVRLAREVRATPDHVSQTLNETLGTRFFEYVARWRIEAAKVRLVQQDASVLEVAIEVGFNSRSTFYKAFRHETGLTPRAFIDQHASTQTDPD